MTWDSMPGAIGLPEHKKAFDCLTAFSREHSLVHERPAEVETLWNRVRAGLLTHLPAAAG